MFASSFNNLKWPAAEASSLHHIAQTHEDTLKECHLHELICVLVELLEAVNETLRFITYEVGSGRSSLFVEKNSPGSLNWID